MSNETVVIMRDDEVKTCEVKFVPLEDAVEDNDFGVFSGGEESYYSDNEPLPVVLEEGEKVEVQDEGDAAVENNVVVIGDRDMMHRVADDVLKDDEGNDGGRERFNMWNQRVTVARFWRTQVDAYEDRIVELEKKVSVVTDGFKAAKRVAEKETDEVERLRRLYMDKISETERLKETIADLISQNCELERADIVRKRNNKRTVQGLRKEVEDERQRTRNLEEELSVTRKRLLRFTRRSVPRVARRVVRRVDSYEDGEESSISVERSTSDEDNEDTRVNKLIRIMDNI